MRDPYLDRLDGRLTDDVVGQTGLYVCEFRDDECGSSEAHLFKGFRGSVQKRDQDRCGELSREGDPPTDEFEDVDCDAKAVLGFPDPCLLRVPGDGFLEGTDFLRRVAEEIDRIRRVGCRRIERFPEPVKVHGETAEGGG